MFPFVPNDNLGEIESKRASNISSIVFGNVEQRLLFEPSVSCGEATPKTRLAGAAYALDHQPILGKRPGNYLLVVDGLAPRSCVRGWAYQATIVSEYADPLR